MRTSLGCRDWKGTWVAGFTSRSLHEGRHWLFYLTRVHRAFESHAELWDNLPARTREMKSAQAHFLGDVFVPRGRVAADRRFDPRRYYSPPCHDHRRGSCDRGWHNDINYWCAKRFGRPSLLVGDPHLTFLWDEPIIRLDGNHSRNYQKWDSIDKLIQHLE
jgi:hypothetical protein